MPSTHRWKIWDLPVDSAHRCHPDQETSDNLSRWSTSGRYRLRPGLELPAHPGLLPRPSTRPSRRETSHQLLGFRSSRLPAQPALECLNFKNLFGLISVFLHHSRLEIMRCSLPDLCHWVRLNVPFGERHREATEPHNPSAELWRGSRQLPGAGLRRHGQSRAYSGSELSSG